MVGEIKKVVNMARMIRVRKRGYHRRAYQRRDGTRVKSSYVSPSTFSIRDRGAPGHGKKLFTIEKGELTKHGYSAGESAAERRRALRKAIREDGTTTTFRRLNAQVLFRKRSRNGAKKAFRSDRDWVQREFM